MFFCCAMFFPILNNLTKLGVIHSNFLLAKVTRSHSKAAFLTPFARKHTYTHLTHTHTPLHTHPTNTNTHTILVSTHNAVYHFSLPRYQFSFELVYVDRIRYWFMGSSGLWHGLSLVMVLLPDEIKYAFYIIYMCIYRV